MYKVLRREIYAVEVTKGLAILEEIDESDDNAVDINV